MPGGVVNIITGRTAEMAPWLASHRDVNAIDLAGAADAEGVDWGALEARRRREPQARPAPCRGGPDGPDAVEPDWSRDAGPAPAQRLPRDQDGLAPQGPLAIQVWAGRRVSPHPR